MKKGFTLVELLVVIVILSLIAMIVYPSIVKVINDSKESTYVSQVEIVIKAAKEWAVEHPSQLPSDESPSDVKVCLKSLVDGGYIDGDVKNPKNSKIMDGYVEITLSNNKYEYNYIDEECS